MDEVARRAPRVLFESLRFLGRWLALYPILGGAAALLIGVVAFDFVEGLGLPDLFWRLPAGKMLLTGASLALTFALMCFVGYLLESKKYELRPIAYFWRTFPVLTLFYLIGVARFDYEPGLKPDTYAHAWVSVLGYAIGVAIALLLGKFVPKNISMHRYATINVLFLVVVYAFLSLTLPPIPSATAICIVLAIVVQVYGFLRFAFHEWNFLVAVTAMLLIGLCNLRSPYKHRYPEYGTKLYETPAAIPPDGGKPNPALIDNNAAFEAWLKANSGPAKPKLVIVATSGGGIRAAVWTAAVLDRLDDIPDFSKRIRMISGASGGMVGASFYVASLHKDVNEKIDFSTLAADSLEPVALTLALRDIPAFLLPRHDDRGVALERAWQRNAPVMKTKLAELAQGERDGWRPSLIFTPTFVEDGRRTLISNLDLAFLARNEGPHGVSTVTYSRPAVELLRVLPTTANLSVASIARMSASFPYVTPASELPTTPRRHVVDAGYWDNYGVAVAVSWLSENFDHIVKDTSGVVLIQIRDMVKSRLTDATLPRESGTLNAFDEFLAPIYTALNGSDSIMILRNDNEVQQIARAFCRQTHDAQFFTTVILENPNESALSWSITDAQAAAMFDSFKDPTGVPAQRVAQLLAWWKRPVSASAAATRP